MRILHIYKDCFPVIGGIENHIDVLSRAQAERGHQVTVLACNPGDQEAAETIDGVEILRARRLFTAWSLPISLAHPITAARLLVAGPRPDIVHVHSPYPPGELCAWRLRRDVPLVITHHSDIVRQKIGLRLYARLLRRVLAAAARIIVTSPAYGETSPWLAPLRDKCRVVPLGVDERRFQPPAEAVAGPATLLFVGKLRHYKGLGTVLRALRDLPNARFDIAGEGPMRARWEALAAELGVAVQVRFLGQVDDARLPALYRQAGIFVLPSDSRAEAFGSVLLEAMASGLPCVTTELGTGTSWIVQDGKTGRVVAADDSDGMADALRDLLGDRERRAAMGRAGRQRVIETFTRERMIAGVMAVYDEAASGAEGRN